MLSAMPPTACARLRYSRVLCPHSSLKDTSRGVDSESRYPAVSLQSRLQRGHGGGSGMPGGPILGLAVEGNTTRLSFQPFVGTAIVEQAVSQSTLRRPDTRPDHDYSARLIWIASGLTPERLRRICSQCPAMWFRLVQIRIGRLVPNFSMAVRGRPQGIQIGRVDSPHRQ
ncbi:hypothetical protein L226DRAFT_308785 [Lentinus tigrinus ALCF2SS1-7]|uniref:uncharacterized protein n=1 Tax=Lentinus tigrinus ALCF2SS1-7 TaxID=1328758 RepID=UPI001165FEAA|nr:hypothetical protein L226DRAFT_308785 [Lentinus tigrinus ALCF2SS1-7]